MLPYKRLTYLSDLSPEQISTKLKNITQEKGTGKSGFQENKYFEGSISENRFKLNHVSDKYFNPVIVGYILTIPSYTKIEMQLKPSKSIIVFLYFIVGFIIGKHWYDSNNIILTILFLVLMFGFQIWYFHNNTIILKRKLDLLFKE